MVNTISQNVLTFIFGRLYSAKAVGNFSQAFKWDTMASTFVSGTISQVAQPVLVEVNGDAGRQVNVFRKMLRFTAFLAFPAMFGLAMISHEFILLLISDKWAESSPSFAYTFVISGAFLTILYNVSKPYHQPWKISYLHVVHDSFDCCTNRVCHSLLS